MKTENDDDDDEEEEMKLVINYRFLSLTSPLFFLFHSPEKLMINGAMGLDQWGRGAFQHHNGDQSEFQQPAVLIALSCRWLNVYASHADHVSEME